MRVHHTARRCETVETADRKTRFGSCEERARRFDWDRSADHIRARSQNGCTLEAGYMTAPVSFREKVRFFSLAPRARARDFCSAHCRTAHLFRLGHFPVLMPE